MPFRTRIDLRERLVSLASGQGGYFTAAQARALGYSYQAQKYHKDRNNWVRVDRGVYRLRGWPSSSHEDLVRWYLWSQQRAVVSHETALSVYELGDVNPARVHLTVPPQFPSKAPGVILHKGELPEKDVRPQGGFRITTPVRTLLDVAAGDLDQDQVSKAVHDAIREGVLTRGDLLARADELGARAALRIERALMRALT
jgi:predicted transcriptional regulator of viral defense system